jgi:hypothetical protein
LNASYSDTLWKLAKAEDPLLPVLHLGRGQQRQNPRRAIDSGSSSAMLTQRERSSSKTKASAASFEEPSSSLKPPSASSALTEEGGVGLPASFFRASQQPRIHLVAPSPSLARKNPHQSGHRPSSGPACQDSKLSSIGAAARKAAPHFEQKTRLRESGRAGRFYC